MLGIVKYCKEHPYEAIAIGASVFVVGFIIGEGIGIDEGIAKGYARKVAEKTVEKLIPVDEQLVYDLVDKSGMAGGLAMIKALDGEVPRGIASQAIANGFMDIFDDNCSSFGVEKLVGEILAG